MSNKSFSYDQIEAYLKGTLQEQDLQAFEEELRNSAELRQAVDNHRIAEDLVIENRLQNIPGILRETHRKQLRKARRAKIAGGIAGILILAGGILWYANQSGSTQSVTHKAPQTAALPDTSNDPGRKPDKTSRHKEKPVPQTAESKQDNNGNKDTPVQTSSAAPAKESKDQSVLPADTLSTQDSSTNKPTQTSRQKQPTQTGKSRQEDTTTSNSTPQDTTKDLSPKASPAAEDPCNKVTISARVSTEKTCRGKSTGEINVSNVQGGTPPYQYTLASGKDRLSKLAAGTYALCIADSNQCRDTIHDIRVVSKTCMQESSFNPFIGETWKIPACKTSGELIIYNQQGQVYFKKDIPANQQAEWSGRSRNGKLQTGYFMYKIEYKDGSAKKGSVTIVR